MVVVGIVHLVIGEHRTANDGTHMCVPYGDRAIADTVAAVERMA